MAVVVLLSLSNKGVNIPLVKYIDVGLASLFDWTPKSYDDPTWSDSMLMMLTSLLTTLLTFVKSTLLILSNGKSVTGNITYSGLTMAETSWNSMVNTFILGLHGLLVSGSDYFIKLCTSPFLPTPTIDDETGPIMYSIVQLVMCGLLFLVIHSYNSCLLADAKTSRKRQNMHRNSIQDNGSNSEDDDGASGLKPLVSSNHQLIQKFRKGYYSDGEDVYFVAKRPRSRSYTNL